MAVAVRGNSRAGPDERLEEGLRFEKAGLLDKALAVYRDVRRHPANAEAVATSWWLEAYVHHARSDWAAALVAARTSADVARELGRNDLLAEALNAEAAVHCGQGRFGEALPLYAAMLELVADPRIRGMALQNIGTIHGRRGEMELAERRLREAYEQFERADYEWGRAHVLNNRVALALDREEYDAAEALAREAVGVARGVDDLDLLAIGMLNLAESLVGLGKLDEAEEEASGALGQFQLEGNAWRRVACFRILGDVNRARDDEDLARRIWERGLALAREIGAEVEIEELVRRLEEGAAE